jgi:predicted DNA-binding ribbon-helix-helix protein
LRSFPNYVTIKRKTGRLTGGGIFMCHMFAGQDPRNYAHETRSVRLMGHTTSVRLEAKFWRIVEDIAQEQHMTLAQFLTKLYA